MSRVTAMGEARVVTSALGAVVHEGQSESPIAVAPLEMMMTQQRRGIEPGSDALGAGTIARGSGGSSFARIAFIIPCGWKSMLVIVGVPGCLLLGRCLSRRAPRPL